MLGANCGNSAKERVQRNWLTKHTFVKNCYSDFILWVEHSGPHSIKRVSFHNGLSQACEAEVPKEGVLVAKGTEDLSPEGEGGETPTWCE